ncbi:helix-turn-helix domain-containing protein, partial [Candidatus Margulisiibacteriota bacterium]
MTPKLTFAEKLLLLRKNKKISQKRVAEYLDIGISNLARYESGRLPSAEILVKLSDFFNVSM